ncbi:MAG TPA: hypothetical protein VG408_07855 [Actinomycetota bacterium]|nr:hypothetical protein [Actinomycetota bacterium]
MSTAAPTARLGWRLLPAVAAAAVAVVAASATIAALRDDAGVIARGGTAVPPVAVASLPAWDMKVFPVGHRARLTDAQRARFEAQRLDVTKLVRRVLDAWLLNRARPEMIETHFSEVARRAAEKVDLALKEGATILERTARIGLEGGVPTSAAAEIKIRGNSWVDRVTLWIRKHDDGWRVVAFDVKRGPAK